MNKLVSILLVFVLCFSLCACGNNDELPSNPIHEEIKRSVKATLIEYVIRYEGARSNYSATFFINETGILKSNGYYECEVTGNISFRNQYGDLRSKRYEIVMEYSPEEIPHQILKRNIF